MRNTLKIVALCVVCLSAISAFSQHSGHHGHHGHHGAASPAQPAVQGSASYAGQQLRNIKALSSQEAQDWIEGKGMGLAKAAELNGYPGPMHVLELRDSLRLTDAQQRATEALMHSHKTEVRRLGAELVEAERSLDSAFSLKSITSEVLTNMTRRIGELQAQIRDSHLQTHLKQTSILSHQQIASYASLRGYTQ